MGILLCFSTLPAVLRRETIIVTKETRQAPISGPKSTGKNKGVYLASFPGSGQEHPTPQQWKSTTNQSLIHFFAYGVESENNQVRYSDKIFKSTSKGYGGPNPKCSSCPASSP